MTERQPAPSHRRRKGEAGFTLIELLVVLVILGLLAALATPQVLKYLGTAKSEVAATQVSNLASILDLYRLEVGAYPSERSGLRALIEAPADAGRWNGPYVVKADALLDPWGAPYQYRQPGEHGAYDLYSLGADQAEGGDGENRDVTSW
ncbi:MAG: type II secretion system major pseudopilin GspG [Alphaproteobacteria bacterium]|nr:type II secretion system major pseudopilin GspG [Alphaproteobacteria bacterium]